MNSDFSLYLIIIFVIIQRKSNKSKKKKKKKNFLDIVRKVRFHIFKDGKIIIFLFQLGLLP